MKCIHPEMETCPRMVAHSNDGTAYCGFDRCIFDHSPTVKGVSPDEPTVTNAWGGKQAESAYAFHLCDPDAMLAMAEVMKQGAEKYERDNWRKLPAEEHFNHMVIHWYAWLKGDRTDDHLAHMLTRAMMCYATARAEERGMRGEQA